VTFDSKISRMVGGSFSPPQSTPIPSIRPPSWHRRGMENRRASGTGEAVDIGVEGIGRRSALGPIAANCKADGCF
jgi:hypothetical protein